MKKLALITGIILVAFSASAMAQDAQAPSQRVQFVKQLYKLAKTGTPAVTLVEEKYPSEELAKLIKGIQGKICYAADPLWQNQDPQPKAKVAVYPIDGDWVQAVFLQYNAPVAVNFKVLCSGSNCVIDDIVSSGLSYKATYKQCQ